MNPDPRFDCGFADRSLLSRRRLIALACGALGASTGRAATNPILDIHQHIIRRRSLDQLTAHQRANGVSKSVILAAAGWFLNTIAGNEDCAALHARYRDDFLFFASADPVEADAIGSLRRYAARGALGFGEMKFKVAIDSPEMHRVYQLAQELNRPVLIHIGGEHNTGFDRFEVILKAYPTVKFLGHATGWWANISSQVTPGVGYPTGRVHPGGLTDRLLANYPNLFGDLSAKSGLGALTRDEEFAAGFVDRHARKLIWGSDCPCLDAKGAGLDGRGCIAVQSLAALRKLVRDPAKLHRILYQNGAELLRLK
jgi:predicted TIM-barrel fold metal-dependent hydrolase